MSNEKFLSEETLLWLEKRLVRDAIIRGGSNYSFHDQVFAVTNSYRKLKTIIDNINTLRQGEGSSIEIYHDNDSFDGPNNLIYVNGLGGMTQRFEGDSLADCLEKAVKEKDN